MKKFMELENVKEFMELLLSRAVKYVGPNRQCWEYCGSRTTGGYGQISFRGVNLRAHRLSWACHNNQEIPKGLYILHSCDNAPCFNPDHLSLGTHQDNMRQLSERGRSHCSGIARRAKFTKKGGNHPFSKINDIQAIFIFKAYKTKKMSVKDLEKLFKVSSATIRSITSGKRFCELTSLLDMS